MGLYPYLLEGNLRNRMLVIGLMFIELTFSSSQEKNQEKENVKRREARCRANAMFPLFLAFFFYSMETTNASKGANTTLNRGK